MIITVWIPIFLTVLAIVMWLLPFDLPGPIDELIVSSLAIAAWIGYIFEWAIRKAIADVLVGDIASIAFIVLIGAFLFIVGYLRFKR